MPGIKVHHALDTPVIFTLTDGWPSEAYSNPVGTGCKLDRAEVGDYPFEGVGWVFGYGDGVVDGEKVFGGTHDIYFYFGIFG